MDSGSRRLGAGLSRVRWGGTEGGRRLGLGLGLGGGAEREGFERGACGVLREWLRDAKAGEIAREPMPNAEKIALMRQVVFADVDELEASGEVVLPEG